MGSKRAPKRFTTPSSSAWQSSKVGYALACLLPPHAARFKVNDPRRRCPAMSVKTRKLEFPCPVCGSGEVFYTCTPNCCYNHVCGACGATFEPETRRKGGVIMSITPPDPPPDATD